MSADNILAGKGTDAYYSSSNCGPGEAARANQRGSRRRRGSGGLRVRDTLYMFAAAVQFLGSLVITPIATRLMSPAEYGYAVTGTVVMQIAFTLAGLGLGVALQQAHATWGQAGARRLLTFAILTAVLSWIVLEMSGPLWVGLFGFHEYSGVPRFAIAWACLSAVSGCHLALLRSEDRLIAFTVLSVSQTVLADSLALGFVALADRSAAAYVAGQAVAQAAAVVFGSMALPACRLKRKDRDRIVALIRFGLPLVPSSMAVLAMGSVDKIVVQHVVGPEEVARYQIAYMLGSVPVILLTMLSNAWMPRLFAANVVGESTRSLRDSIIALNRLCLPVLVGLNALAPFFLRFWAPPSFRPEDLLRATAVVSLSLLPAVTGITASRALVAVGRPGRLALPNLAGPVINALIGVLLVPRLGIVGAAIAALAAYVIMYGSLTLIARQTQFPKFVGTGMRYQAAALTGVAVLAATPLSTSGEVLRLIVGVVAAMWGCLEVTRVVRR